MINSNKLVQSNKDNGLINTGDTNTIFQNNLPSWIEIENQSLKTATAIEVVTNEKLRQEGEGPPNTDAKLRLFGTKEPPRVILFRDTAAWCPYCQKVWILLEEKRIPYRIEKINMRSYGDKPPEFLRMVPNGLLPAVSIDGVLQTESLEIMLNLDKIFTGAGYKKMWPAENDPEFSTANRLMRLERDLFSRWCNLVFRPNMGKSAMNRFQEGLDLVNQALMVTPSPWFLTDFSIVDLTYVTHLERMFASVLYWCKFQIRGTGRWPAIERWIEAFEMLPSYMATKSDYYTHVMDIPPQYGPSYPVDDWEVYAKIINGQDDKSWRLPLPPLSIHSLETIIPAINPGDESARHEAAQKLISNHDNVNKFALRGAGKPGAKRFQAPLADPYAIPALEYFTDMDYCLKLISMALLEGDSFVTKQNLVQYIEGLESSEKKIVINKLIISLQYFRDRIGVPRDMSYPAARQLRAHINWMIDQFK